MRLSQIRKVSVSNQKRVCPKSEKWLSQSSLRKMIITLKPFGKYWQDLAQKIANWHLSSVEAMPRSKFWKSENSPISWTEWNIVMICFAYTLILTRCSPSHLSLVEALPRSRLCRGPNSEKKWNWLYLLNLLEQFDKKKCIHINTDKSRHRDCQMQFLFSAEAMPRSKFWKSKLKWT